VHVSGEHFFKQVRLSAYHKSISKRRSEINKRQRYSTTMKHKMTRYSGGSIIFCLVLTFQSFLSVLSTIPPHPDLVAEGYENVHQYRRRLGINYNFNPRWITPELCRNSTEEQCRALDQNFGNHVESNRKIISPHKFGAPQLEFPLTSQQTQRKLQKPESKGTLRVLVMLLQWTNHENDERELVAPADYQLLFTADDIDDVLYPSGSINRFFDLNSHQNLNVIADVMPWQLTDNTESFYAQMGLSGVDAGLQDAFTPLLDGLGDDFDFSPYDQDQNAIIDLVVFLHSGYAAERGVSEMGASSCTFAEFADKFYFILL
jgi:hypothetical protein